MANQAPIEAPRQRAIQNVSYNYLVEACVDKNKSKVVLNMMTEALSEEADLFDDVYKNSELDERLIEQILLNTEVSFSTKLTEAHSRSPELAKKIIIGHYGKIIKDEFMRKELWLMIARLPVTKKHYPKSYYYDLLNSKLFPPIYDDIISKDVERTKGSITEKKIMKNILAAYSRRNSKVGYVQGQNFIIRLIIDIIPEELDAFWIFCFVVEECFSVSYFINLKSLMLDALVFRIILKAVEPKLAVHLEQIKDFDLDIITFKWFICLYADSQLAPDFQKKIWDLLVLGDKLVYLKAGFVILHSLSPRLCKCNDIGEVYAVLEKTSEILGKDSIAFIQKVSNFFISEYVLDIVRVSNQSKLQKAAEIMRKQAFKEMKSLPIRSKELLCDGRSVICKNNIEPEGADRDFFSFSCKGILKNKIFDYFSEENGFWEANKKRKGSHIKENDMLVHRGKHTCTQEAMYKNYSSYIKTLLTTEYKQGDARSEIIANFLKENKLMEHSEDDERPYMEAEESEEMEVRTIRKGSSVRVLRFNTVPDLDTVKLK